MQRVRLGHHVTVQRERFEVIRCVVVGSAPYGVLVETSDGEEGWVEAEYLDHGPVDPTRWPFPGTHLDAVVLGYANDGRIRVASTPAYVEMIRTLPEVSEEAVSAAWSHWRSER